MCRATVAFWAISWKDKAGAQRNSWLRRCSRDDASAVSEKDRTVRRQPLTPAVRRSTPRYRAAPLGRRAAPRHRSSTRRTCTSAAATGAVLALPRTRRARHRQLCERDLEQLLRAAARRRDRARGAPIRTKSARHLRLVRRRADRAAVTRSAGQPRDAALAEAEQRKHPQARGGARWDPARHARPYPRTVRPAVQAHRRHLRGPAANRALLLPRDGRSHAVLLVRVDAAPVRDARVLAARRGDEANPRR